MNAQIPPQILWPLEIYMKTLSNYSFPGNTNSVSVTHGRPGGVRPYLSPSVSSQSCYIGRTGFQPLRTPAMATALSASVTPQKVIFRVWNWKLFTSWSEQPWILHCLHGQMCEDTHVWCLSMSLQNQYLYGAGFSNTNCWHKAGRTLLFKI